MSAGPFSERRPLLCVVTDRARLGTFPSTQAAIDGLVAHAAAAAEAGIDLFQIREPDLPDAALLTIAERAHAAAKGSGMRVSLNDRLDIALAACLDGVHLRGTSFAAARARALAPRPFLIGRSVHSAEEASAAEAAGGLDYLILGTIFPTASKPPEHGLAGLDTLRDAVRGCRLPILAIGGLTLDNAAAVAETGAAGLAAIGLFATPRSLRDTVVRLREIFTAAPGRA